MKIYHFNDPAKNINHYFRTNEEIRNGGRYFIQTVDSRNFDLDGHLYADTKNWETRYLREEDIPTLRAIPNGLQVVR